MAVTENKRHPHRRRELAGGLCVLMFMAAAPSAQALEWRFEPGVSTKVTYTDNVNQRAVNPQDALILSVTPDFTLRSEGSSRLQATLQYGLSGVARFGDDNTDDVNHILNANGKAELVEDFLFIDGSARISQELISLFGSPADAEINNSNRASVGTYSISPYIQKRFGTFSNAQVRYTASGAVFENDVSNNSSVNALTAGLTSGTRFNDLTWALNYSIRKAENRNAANTTFENASAQLGYALTRKFRVFGTVGQDWNDYPSIATTDGSFYSAGFGWSPTRRTSVEASAGEHYFGRTYSFAGSHRTRLSQWTARYEEGVSDMTKLNRDFQGASLKSCPLGTVLPINPTLGDLLKAECDVDLYYATSISSGVFLSKLLTAGVSWQAGGRTNLSVTLSDLTREYQLVRSEDQVRRATGAISYRLSPKTSVNGSLSFSRTSEVTVGSAREDDLTSVSLGLSHSFAEDVSGALTFRHAERDSNVAISNYKENSLSAMVSMGF